MVLDSSRLAALLRGVPCGAGAILGKSRARSVTTHDYGGGFDRSKAGGYVEGRCSEGQLK